MQDSAQQSHAATRAEIIDLLGSIDDVVVQQILATDATVDEIAGAIGALEGRSKQPHVAPTRRMALVRGILEDALGTTR